MYIGLGIVLIVLGLVFLLDVIQFNFEYISEQPLGWILLIAGILAIVLSLVWTRRAGAARLEERTYVDRGPVDRGPMV